MRRPGLRPGGWAFQYNNPHYPDVDDTAVVGMLLHRNGDPPMPQAIDRAREWVIGMQSSDGGWGAFEPENTHLYLNHIPFADHGALLDPPTADVSARCVSFLAQIGMPADDPVMVRALAYLRREQEADGSWFGRWGTNYIYGTWSVLCALNAAGLPHDDPAITRAVDWLVSVQRDDGGWGEDEESYADAPHGRYKESTPSQTAWAVLGLDGRRRNRSSGHRARHRLSGRHARNRMANGPRRPTPLLVSPASSTCATTATSCIFRCSRWPATATCAAATRAGSSSVSDALRLASSSASPPRHASPPGSAIRLRPVAARRRVPRGRDGDWSGRASRRSSASASPAAWIRRCVRKSDHPVHRRCRTRHAAADNGWPNAFGGLTPHTLLAGSKIAAERRR